PFIFSLLPTPPPSPLFPYTTLFRSTFSAEQEQGVNPSSRNRAVEKVAVVAALLFALVVLACGRRRRVSPTGWRQEDFDTSKGLEDRKSTRLNSSHVAISYAVFCLKK